ncbi:MAG: leucine-rich repeat protein [Prevotella sp.]|nr:leucine-rich repeat protein [Prevotella sp.]
MNTKRFNIRHMLIACLMMAVSSSAWAASVGDTFTQGVLQYKITESRYVTVSGTTIDHTYDGVIEVPMMVSHDGNDYIVNAIGDEAFAGKDFKGITLPASIKTIGDDAFRFSSGFTEIRLPKNVTSIGNTAFGESLDLTDIYILSNPLPTTANDAFADFSGTIHIPYVSTGYQSTQPWSQASASTFTIVNDADVIDINATNFPDEAFRNYLLAQTYGTDGKITLGEIETITEINVDETDIASLKGIEFFTALKILEARWIPIETIDLSGNTNLEELYLQDNKLTALNVSSNTNLKILVCNANELTTLDISNNIDLEYLTCSNNKITYISGLNGTEGVALKGLYCSNNKLSYLEPNKELQALDCRNNSITYLYLNDYNKLQQVDCSDNSIGDSYSFSNCPLLYTISMNNCNTTTMDKISNCSSLRDLYVNDNELIQINLSNAGCEGTLETIECQNNQLTSLNLNAFTKLKNLNCSSNQIESLEISSCNILRKLICKDNLISNLTLTGFSNIYTIDCSKNKLSWIDISGLDDLIYFSGAENELNVYFSAVNPKLEMLNLRDNKITGMYLDCPKLEYLNIQNNSMTNIDLSQCPNLGANEGINNYGSQMKQSLLTQQIETDGQVLSDGRRAIDFQSWLWTGEHIEYMFFFVDFEKTIGYTITDPVFVGDKLVIEHGGDARKNILYRYRTGNALYSVMTVYITVNDIPPTEVSYTTPASGVGTYSSKYPLDFTNSNLKAYVASGFGENSVLLTRIYKVPAGTGIVVKGAKSTEYQIPVRGCNMAYANLLIPVVDQTLVQPTVGNRINLSLSSGKFLTFTIPSNLGPNRAYLQVLTSVMQGSGSSSAKEYLTLEFEDEDSEATGIESVDKSQTDEGAWYTIHGVKLPAMPTEKGIYIHNGKKVVIK